MTDATDIFARLAAPFPPEEVEWRVGSTNRRKWEEAKKRGETTPRRGLPLCYHDARMVMDRLDSVLPDGGWQAEPLPMHNGTFCCRIGIQLPDRDDWIWRGDGAGPTGDVADPQSREMAQKGGFSDAFKRAGVMFGIGRYLYSIKAPWIELDEWWGIPDKARPNLQALLARNGAPAKSARQSHKDGDYQRIETALRACTSVTGLAKVWKAEQTVITQWPDKWREAVTEEKDACKAALEGKNADKASGDPKERSKAA